MASVTQVGNMGKILAGAAAVLVLSGCASAPFNKSPAQLKESPALIQVYKVDATLDGFMQRSFEARKMCADSLGFERSPDRSMAVGMVQLPGLTSIATIVYAEAIEKSGKTEVRVWLHSDGWKNRVKKYIDQIIDPEICIK